MSATAAAPKGSALGDDAGEAGARANPSVVLAIAPLTLASSVGEEAAVEGTRPRARSPERIASSPVATYEPEAASSVPDAWLAFTPPLVRTLAELMAS